MEPTRKEFVLAALVMLLIPAMAELALRVAGVEFSPQFYIGDRQRGWVLRRGMEGKAIGEAAQYIRINSKGFRDGERSYDKPANTYRIAVLGNSWTEALQVAIESTYSSTLERLLQECVGAGRRVEVLNFGVSGYSTAQELLLLQQEVVNYHPDLVIVAFYSARDVVNNVRAFNNAANPEQSPYFVYRDGRLVLDDSFRALPDVQPRQILIQKLRLWLNEHVRVLHAVNELVRYRRARVAAATVRHTARASGITDLEHVIYHPPESPEMEEAWRITEGLLVAIRDQARTHGAELVIVTLANRPQVHPGRAQRLAFMRVQKVADLAYADERIRQLGLREGIPVINLAPPLAAYAEAHQVYLNGFNATNFGEGHWNETGHRVAGEVIAERLCGHLGHRPVAISAAAK